MIRNEADEQEDEFVEKKSNMSFAITDYDDDYYPAGTEPVEASETSPASPLSSNPVAGPAVEESKEV